MKPAPFRLERVLQLRQIELDRVCVKLATAEGELQAARASRERCSMRASSASSALAERATAGLSAGEYRAAALDIEVSQAAIREAFEQERACEVAAAEAREAVLAARSRVRALEKLRERKQDEARKRFEHAQQKQLDEIAVRGVVARWEDRP